ncbi:MAG: hypothetical protein Q8L64_06965 [bacterium]|nr:hypothetical protein [bacterium]
MIKRTAIACSLAVLAIGALIVASAAGTAFADSNTPPAFSSITISSGATDQRMTVGEKADILFIGATTTQNDLSTGYCMVNDSDVRSSFRSDGNGVYRADYIVASDHHERAPGTIPFDCTVTNGHGISLVISAFESNSVSIDINLDGVFDPPFGAPTGTSTSTSTATSTEASVEPVSSGSSGGSGSSSSGRSVRNSSTLWTTTQTLNPEDIWIYIDEAYIPPSSSDMGFVSYAPSGGNVPVSSAVTASPVEETDILAVSETDTATSSEGEVLGASIDREDGPLAAAGAAGTGGRLMLITLLVLTGLAVGAYAFNRNSEARRRP